MKIEYFWELIDSTRNDANGDSSKHVDLLVNRLAKHPADEILAYEKIRDGLLDDAYDAALWDAADIVGCGCSDDGFRDFRAWLISKGKVTYGNALIDPETLVDLVDVNEDPKYEAFLYVAMEAYEKTTGRAWPKKNYHTKRHSSELTGVHWDEDKRRERFPKLTAKFGDCEERWARWSKEDFSS